MTNVNNNLACLQSVSNTNTENDEVISFWRETEKPYGVFSNYYPAPIEMVIGDTKKTYASSEVAYQCLKFNDLEYQKVIRTAKTIHQSKLLASQRIAAPNQPKWSTDLNPIIQYHLKRGVKIRPDWEAVKLTCMLRCLSQKFIQHPKLAEILLSTRNNEIRETSPYDVYWGWYNGKGENHLGFLLMQVRTHLRTKQLNEKIALANNPLLKPSESIMGPRVSGMRQSYRQTPMRLEQKETDHP